MEENSHNVRKSSTVAVASAVFATAGVICLIVVASWALSIQYTRGFRTARGAVIAAGIAFFVTEIVALILGVIAFRRACSLGGALTDKGDSLFGIISSLIYLGIAIFFLLQITG